MVLVNTYKYALQLHAYLCINRPRKVYNSRDLTYSRVPNNRGVQIRVLVGKNSKI